MGLVDRDQREADGFEPLEGLGLQQRFRRHVEQVQFAPLDVAPEQILFGAPEPGIERRRPDPGLAQRRHLVFHQRNERRDDEADARADQRRDLVAERFAAAGRHQDERVMAGDHMLDDLALPIAEAVVAENSLQDGEEIRRHGDIQILEE